MSIQNYLIHVLLNFLNYLFALLHSHSSSAGKSVENITMLLEELKLLQVCSGFVSFLLDLIGKYKIKL